jgi:hypothetical protein
MPRLSVKAKTLITVLIPSVRLGPVIILVIEPSLYITLRIAVIYPTLITLIYFVIKGISVIYK